MTQYKYDHVDRDLISNKIVNSKIEDLLSSEGRKV